MFRCLTECPESVQNIVLNNHNEYIGESGFSLRPAVGMLHHDRVRYKTPWDNELL